MTTTSAILTEVLDERLVQDQKWGPQNHSLVEWLAILAEEFGEASKEIVEYHFQLTPGEFLPVLIRKAMVTIAAVAVATVEQIDNGCAQCDLIHDQPQGLTSATR